MKNTTCALALLLLIIFNAFCEALPATQESSKIILYGAKDTEAILNIVNLYYEKIIKGSFKEAYELRSFRVKNILKYDDFKSSYKSLLENVPNNSITLEKAKLLFVSDKAIAAGNSLIFYFPISDKDHLGEVNLKLVTFVINENGLWRIDDTGIEIVAANLDLVAILKKQE